MALLQLTLLGGLTVSTGRGTVPVAGRKERLLLAYLAMPVGKSRPREGICGLLWGERSDKQAHDSLKVALYRLRRSLGAEASRAIVADRAFIMLDPAAVKVDLVDYERLLEQGGDAAKLRAIGLYHGDLLEGLDGRDRACEDWLDPERERLRSLQTGALVSLLQRGPVDPGSPPDALARKLLVLDPLHEVAHRALMRHHAELGQTALAARQYHRCRALLRKELGVDPEPATEQLWYSIRSDPAIPRRIVRDQPATAAASIEVLPFANLSGEPGDNAFAAGLAEDIAIDLARWSTFAVSSGPLAEQPAGRKSGARARLVVKGSIRRVGNWMRVTAHLTDGDTGHHLWVERFDQAMDCGPFSEAAVVGTIVGTIAGRIQAMEARRVQKGFIGAVTAQDYTIRSNALSWDDPALARVAKLSFKRAIEIDPGFARPYSLLAVLIAREWRNDPSCSRQPIDNALKLAEQAVVFADGESTGHTSLGYIHLERHECDLALRHMRRGVELNPLNPWIQVDLGYLLGYIGQAEEAREALENARRRDPFIGAPWYWGSLGLSNFALGRYADALAAFDSAGNRAPLYAIAMTAACCQKLGHRDRARLLLAPYRQDTIQKVLAKIPFKNEVDARHLHNCLNLINVTG